jgi:spore coat protein CotH
MWRNALARLALAGCLLGSSPPTPAAQSREDPPEAAASADQFFDGSVVSDIHLTMSDSAWATLKENYLANTYYPCTFEWNGMVVGNATVRSRGSGTRNPQKPGLRVDFNRYNTSQRFLGLKYIVLDNAWQDASMIKERVSMLLLGMMGIPAPRETHARLFMNGEYAGLYIAVEALDDVFVERTFGSTDGYLYEYNWESEYRFEYRGPELAAYRMFDPKTRTKDPDALIWGPLEAMVRTMNVAPDAIFVREMSQYLDLGLFTRQIAIDAFMAESDGLLGDWGVNNIYLYRPGDSVRFQVLEWDKDNTFHGTDYPLLKGVAENVLARRTLNEPAFMDLYRETLLEVAAAVEPEPGGTAEESDASRTAPRTTMAPGLPRRDRAGWLEGEIRREYGQIREFARADVLKPVTNDEFEAAIADLVRFARARPLLVRAQADRLRIGK